MQFEFFRINVFAIRKNDDILTAAGDRKVTAFVDDTEVAGMKPSISDGFCSFLRRAIVTFHQNGSAYKHLAYALIIWVIDPDRHPTNRFTDCTEPVIARRRHRRSSRRLGKPIGLKDRI